MLHSEGLSCFTYDAAVLPHSCQMLPWGNKRKAELCSSVFFFYMQLLSMLCLTRL